MLDFYNTIAVDGYLRTRLYPIEGNAPDKLSFYVNGFVLLSQWDMRDENAVTQSMRSTLNNRFATERRTECERLRSVFMLDSPYAGSIWLRFLIRHAVWIKWEPTSHHIPASADHSTLNIDILQCACPSNRNCIKKNMSRRVSDQWLHLPIAIHYYWLIRTQFLLSKLETCAIMLMIN